MKKNILMLSALIFSLTMFTSCEKNENLSDFVMGKWQSQDLVFGDATAVFLANFKADTFTFTLKSGNTSILSDPSTYTVDNKLNTLMMTDPNFAGKKSGDPIMRTFSVEWTSKGRTMTWTPDANSGGQAFVWTRQ